MRGVRLFIRAGVRTDAHRARECGPDEDDPPRLERARVRFSYFEGRALPGRPGFGRITDHFARVD